MMNSSVTVSAELGLNLVVPDHGSVPLVASLYYNAEDPYAIVAQLMDAMPSGSYLAVSHMGGDLLDTETRHEAEDIGDRMVQQQLTFRSREQVTRFFDGTDLLAPGLAWVEEWRPEPDGTGADG